MALKQISELSVDDIIQIRNATDAVMRDGNWNDNDLVTNDYVTNMKAIDWAELIFALPTH